MLIYHLHAPFRSIAFDLLLRALIREISKFRGAPASAEVTAAAAATSTGGRMRKSLCVVPAGRRRARLRPKMDRKGLGSGISARGRAAQDDPASGIGARASPALMRAARVQLNPFSRRLTRARA